MTDEQRKRDGRRRSHSDEGRSLAQEARDLILEDIVQCRLRPGEMVQLATLAEKYDMSKTPVREALTMLQDDGLVEAIPYRGYVIRPIDISEINEIYFMRRLLEGAACELAAKNITDEELEQLGRLVAPETMVMTLEYDEYARTFHSVIARASGMEKLEDIVLRTYNDMRRLQYAGIGRPRPGVITDEHVGILEALRARDAERARQLMEEHIDNIRRRALET
jgi:DNA-binding GntR family transcriptional regulator